MLRALFFGAHVICAAAHTALCIRAHRSSAVWHPFDALAPLRQAGADTDAAQLEALASSPTALATQKLKAGSPPFFHLRNRGTLIVHVLFLALACSVCMQVVPDAERELDVSLAPYMNAPRITSSLSAAAPAASVRRSQIAEQQQTRQRRDHALNSAAGEGETLTLAQLTQAADLSKAERGRLQERLIAERAAALRALAEEDARADAARLSSSAAPRVKSPASAPAGITSASNGHAIDGSALAAVVFHMLSLPLALAHAACYSGWSWLDPRMRPAWRAPVHTTLSRQVATTFKATTAMAVIHALTLLVTLFSLVRAVGNQDASSRNTPEDAFAAWGWLLSPGQEDDEELLASLARTLSPAGLVAGLLYLPFLLLHASRLTLNLWLASQFRSRHFPNVGQPRRRAQKKKGAAAAAVATTKQESKTEAARRLRREEEPAAVDAAEISEDNHEDVLQQQYEQENEQAVGDEADADEGFDILDLKELASFADGNGTEGDNSAASVPTLLSPISLSAALDADPSGDSLMQPSALIAKLRQTPKLARMLLEQEQQKARQQAQRTKRNAAPTEQQAQQTVAQHEE